MKQKEAEKNAKLEEQETKRATKTEQGVDGSMKTTTTTVTTHKTQGNCDCNMHEDQWIALKHGIAQLHLIWCVCLIISLDASLLWIREEFNKFVINVNDCY